jgi:hypothetical protein
MELQERHNIPMSFQDLTQFPKNVEDRKKQEKNILFLDIEQ